MQPNIRSFFEKQTANKDAGDKRKRSEDADKSPETQPESSLTDKKKQRVADPEEDPEILEAEAQEKEQEVQKREDAAVAKEISCLSVPEASGKLGKSWNTGKDVPYAILCETFSLCGNTTKRTEITEYLVSLFLKIIQQTPNALLHTLYMCINKLCPDYEGLELGIGETLLVKAIAQSTGRKPEKIQEDYSKTGDLGTVAENSKQSQRTLFAPKPLTVQHVFKTLKEIAQITGQSSQSNKIRKIQGLLVACQGHEAKFLIRQLEGKLRIGLAEQTVLTALAHAVVLSQEETQKLSVESKEQKLASAVDTVKSVYNQLPCYDMLIPALLEYPMEQLLERCTMRPGIPLKPMLAHPTKSLKEVLDRFEDQSFTCEFKYDGERAQIHRLHDGSTKIYSRNSEDMSVKYPDIVDKIEKWVGSSTTSFILDCEAVAWDVEKKCILPFQVLSTRKRKDVKEEDIKVRVAIFAFDCLYLNGESLLQRSLKERREKLRASFKVTDNEFYFAEHMDTNKIEDIQTFLDVSIQSSCEGLMVKLYENDEASYEPSKRSRNWLKVKKDYLAGVGDTVDLVVIGAFKGKGKRTNVYGSFLLACYDPETEEYQTVCKLGTGFSDENLQKFYTDLNEHKIQQPKRFYCIGENPETPDVWFAPHIVWEIQCADLSISPRYMAGVGVVDPTKGISLRFPRFIRSREDKDPEDITSSDQIIEFYRRQQQNHDV
ncbi:dna ligase [Lichtheimia corymbifera JMRC:FSU:9682]|uniref:DNA ligase n=1 Tax=Lichtheimia corymbifera JMRC:FSU:9682 TaxID=1263082 RepID=A0A068S0M9_9FUNG|nr:dna ligase [Lichtheimia corymbifera JMRC:FSU:9682]